MMNEQEIIESIKVQRNYLFLFELKKKGLLESLSRINKNISETKDKIYSRATYFERVE